MALRDPSREATVIIPQHERPDLTCACIRSLRATDPVAWPVIVVDDGSSSNCRQIIIAAEFRNACVLLQRRMGVSAAWNRGADAAGTPFLVFLNNDVLADGPFIGRLIEPLKTGKARVSGVQLRQETALPAAVLQNLPADRFLEGWCFAAAREGYRRVGGFDETMRIYWSDTDFQARLISRAPGCAGMIRVPNLPLQHLGHRTARQLPERRRIWRADRRRFLKKWTSQ